MADDYFDAKLALNPETGNVVPGASAQVYSFNDTSFSTPLAITDMAGIPLGALIASPTGIYPQFRVVSGEQNVLAKSGAMLTPITSVEGSRGPKGDPGEAGAGADPTNSEPGQVLTSTGPTTPPKWLPPASGAGGGVATRYESPLGSGNYPPRGTIAATRVDWVGVEQPIIRAAGADFVNQPYALDNVDFFHRVVI